MSEDSFLLWILQLIIQYVYRTAHYFLLSFGTCTIELNKAIVKMKNMRYTRNTYGFISDCVSAEVIVSATKSDNRYNLVRLELMQVYTA